MPTGFRPLARTSGLLTEQLDDELLVYDEDGQTACRLNRTAALVWQNDPRPTVEASQALAKLTRTQPIPLTT